jgi:hypothetical protein
LNYALGAFFENASMVVCLYVFSSLYVLGLKTGIENPYLSKVVLFLGLLAGLLLGLLAGLFLAVRPRFKGRRHFFVFLSRTCPSGHGFFDFTVVLLLDFLPRFKGGLHSFVVLSMT